MKVVLHSDARVWGGNEKWLLQVASGLAARGHEVLVSCVRGEPVAERARAAGLRITHRRPGGDADLPRALGFARLLRQERPDAVLLSAFKRAFWGGWACHAAGVPRVVERLGIEQGLPARWKYRKPFRDWIDALIVNSPAIRERWLASAPWFPASEVHVILNAVLPPAHEDRSLRQELQVPPEVPLLAAAGRLEHRKGFDLLLASLARLPDPRVRLLIAGDGVDGPALRRQAETLGVAGRVHWLGFRRDLERVLLAADVFVLPSRREGMANVMLEAMAAGCLVVAAEISGVPEALGARAGRSPAGWTFRPDDVAALTASLEQALASLGTGEAGVRRAETSWRVSHWFTPERMIEQVEQVLRPGPQR